MHLEDEIIDFIKTFKNKDTVKKRWVLSELIRF